MSSFSYTNTRIVSLFAFCCLDINAKQNNWVKVYLSLKAVVHHGGEPWWELKERTGAEPC